MVGVETEHHQQHQQHHQQQHQQHQRGPSNNRMAISRVNSRLDITASDKFPAGLRVLAVDDDPTCLMILARMLQRCSYEVTTRTRATEALSLLRENKDCFDLVISDVYMPDMDGFKLLEYVGLEMDLPVIMTSSHGETSVVMKGVTHGACDYLIKPVRIEELRNIWQHVLRKKRIDASKDVEASASVEENNNNNNDRLQQQQQRRGSDDGEYTSSVNEESNNWKLAKRRKDDDDGDHDNDDPSTIKKQRVVWSQELHQQFVNAVNQLGIDKAVPKKILELMNVQGLTRENVASHLQKYRLYLRRLSGVQQPVVPNAGYCSSPEPCFPSFNGVSDMRALAAAGQLQQHTLASLQGGGAPLNRNGSLVDPSAVLMHLHHPQAAAAAGYFNAGNTGKVPPPLLSIPGRGCGLDMVVDSSHISPRTAGVDEVSGMVLQQQQQQQQFPNAGCLIPQGDTTTNLCTAGGGMLQASASYYATSNSESSSFGLPASCRGFGSKMASLSLQSPQASQEFGIINNKQLPARFAAEGGGVAAGRFASSEPADGSYSVKLEGGNNQDDLFSIFLKPVT